ncbi:hypothetical protein CMV_021811 [Castanea mollissima]|uniref:GH10 domain-containing protein n=1 Tax=Castanea mollissima TaxID=60419 RepID=A0A8J4QJG3_9ROSI|nr:hypothetical protein CMV_021811 [Castanea mollissima]
MYVHFSTFEDKLGPNASATFYNAAQRIDGTSTLFLIEYNTIEDSNDPLSTPAKYVEKLKQIQSFPGNNNMLLGIGLEAHFNNPPDIAYVRSSIETLASTGLPIWITELDIARGLGQQHPLLPMGRGHLWSPTSKGYRAELAIFETGDFGLARLLFDATRECSIDQSSSIGVRGTIGYAPPEYGTGNEVSTYGFKPQAHKDDDLLSRLSS